MCAKSRQCVFIVSIVCVYRTTDLLNLVVVAVVFFLHTLTKSCRGRTRTFGTTLRPDTKTAPTVV